MADSMAGALMRVQAHEAGPKSLLIDPRERKPGCSQGVSDSWTIGGGNFRERMWGKRDSVQMYPLRQEDSTARSLLILDSLRYVNFFWGT